MSSVCQQVCTDYGELIWLALDHTNIEEQLLCPRTRSCYCQGFSLKVKVTFRRFFPVK